MIKKLDLHGVKHEDVRTKVIHLIEDNWNTDNELEIITGHSNKMKDLVITVVDEYNLLYNVGRVYEASKNRIVVFME